jgi:hypothetical protein
MAATSAHLPPPTPSLLRRISTFFYRRPRLSLFATLALPLFWLVVVYLGALLALVLQSFYGVKASPAGDAPVLAGKLSAVAATGQHRHHHAHGDHGCAGDCRRRAAGVSAGVLHGALCLIADEDGAVRLDSLPLGRNTSCASMRGN